MNIVNMVAESVGDVPKKVVRSVYETLVSQVASTLKKDRKVRLPGLGIISVRFRPPKQKRRGINPFTKKEQWFKARPASNKLKFRPAKELKQMVEKMPAVAPKKKR